jgi:hypothetical protein
MTISQLKEEIIPAFEKAHDPAEYLWLITLRGIQHICLMHFMSCK